MKLRPKQPADIDRHVGKISQIEIVRREWGGKRHIAVLGRRAVDRGERFNRTGYGIDDPMKLVLSDVLRPR